MYLDYRTQLDRLQRFGIHLGLERVCALLHRLHDPQMQFPVIHVGGTNGKGSVCAFLSEILRAAGYRVGRYTSPHLVDWPERIWLDGAYIAPERLQACLERVSALSAGLPADLGVPTQFEVFTCAAFLYFAEERLDIAVIEVGLGGRLDATNVFERPLVSVLTGISLDHCDRLGDTLAAIAMEKAGILRPGRPLVSAPLPEEADRVVHERARALDVPVHIAPPALGAAPGRVCWQGFDYELFLSGDVQLQNSATALQVCRVLRTQGWNLSEKSLRMGLAATNWPGRYQWVGEHLLIDGAHNPEAAARLRAYLDYHRPGAVRWLIGVLETRDARSILGALLRSGDTVMTVPIAGVASHDPRGLSAIAHLYEGITAQDYSSLEEALAEVEQHRTGLSVLCGSLYLVGEYFACTSNPNS